MPHQCTNCGNTFPDGSKEMLSGCPECGGNKFKFDPSGSSSSTGGTESAGSTTGGTESAGSTTGGTESTRSDSSDPLASRSWPGESVESETTESQPTADSPTTADQTTPDPPTTADRSSESSGIDATDGDFVSSDPQPTSGRNTTPDRPGSRSGRDPHADVETEMDDEDTAQADARSEMVSGSELPDETPTDRAETSPSREPATDASAADTPEKVPQTGTAEGETEEEADFEDLREELNDQFESIRIVRPGQYELNLMELYDREEYIIELREDGRYVIELPEAWDDPDE
jgi:predicted  nucleic acid-binding Zn-ribbon protein